MYFARDFRIEFVLKANIFWKCAIFCEIFVRFEIMTDFVSKTHNNERRFFKFRISQHMGSGV